MVVYTGTGVGMAGKGGCGGGMRLPEQVNEPKNPVACPMQSCRRLELLRKGVVAAVNEPFNPELHTAIRVQVTQVVNHSCKIT